MMWDKYCKVNKQNKTFELKVNNFNEYTYLMTNLYNEFFDKRVIRFIVLFILFLITQKSTQIYRVACNNV